MVHLLVECGPMITISIVSHGHAGLLPGLLADIAQCPDVSNVILTHNTPEPTIRNHGMAWMTELENQSPRGFGANHNAAFQLCDTPYFCALNPDVRFRGDPFPELVTCMTANRAALAAPAAVNCEGRIEDNARRFPTVTGLMAKALGIADGRYPYVPGGESFTPEWVSGMFMLLASDKFAGIGGFDEGYYLYYEDVDLCARLRIAGESIRLCPNALVVHAARRESRRNITFLRWHLASMARYFAKRSLWRVSGAW